MKTEEKNNKLEQELKEEQLDHATGGGLIYNRRPTQEELTEG